MKLRFFWALAALFSGALIGMYSFNSLVRNSVANTQQADTAYDRVMKTGVLRCGYILWPAMVNRDPNTGAMSGYMADAIEEIGRKYGFKIEWSQELFLGQQVSELARGNIDAVCGNEGTFNYSEGAFVDYSKPLGFYKVYVWVRKDDARFVSREPLNNAAVRFSGLDGDLSTLYVPDFFPRVQVMSLPQSTDYSVVLQNVADGKADAVIMDEYTVVLFERSNGHRLRRIDMTPLSSFSVNFSVHKGETKLLTMLNQGVDLLAQFGALKRLMDKYALQGTGMYVPDDGFLQETNVK